MSDLILVEPSKEYEKQALEYRQEYIDYGEQHINGSCGLMHYSNYDEWFEKVRLAQKAKELCISKVMISCDKDNTVSGKVALKSGGILEREGFNEKVGPEIQTYWIEVFRY